MGLNNQDILFASIMGSDAVASIERFNLLQNNLEKKVLPPIPFLPNKYTDEIKKIDKNGYNDTGLWKADTALTEDQQFFPLSFSFTRDGAKWLFPYEPMITTGSGNVITESNVAKQGDGLIGTIKERWSRKDFDISITGVLIGAMLKGKPEECYPVVAMQNLFDFLKAAKVIYVHNFALEKMDVHRVVIYDYSFPFTKGENVQAYDIKCKSDYAYNLLIEVDND